MPANPSDRETPDYLWDAVVYWAAAFGFFWGIGQADVPLLALSLCVLFRGVIDSAALRQAQGGEG